MELHVDDDGFVRAPAAACYRTLTDIEGWAVLLPDTVATRREGDTYDLVLGAGRRPIRVTAVAGGWRHDTGFTLTLTGDIVGTAEFWLEPGWGGTVVHHLLHATTDGAVVATRRRYRAWLRTGLWALKDQLQTQERSRQGLGT